MRINESRCKSLVSKLVDKIFFNETPVTSLNKRASGVTCTVTALDSCDSPSLRSSSHFLISSFLIFRVADRGKSASGQTAQSCMR